MPARRPTRIDHLVDGVKLRAQLTSAALDALGDPAGQRRQALAILKAALARGRLIAKERLEDGASGGSTARMLSRVTDEVVTALWDFTTVHMLRARNPTEGERMALMAVGGYGRGALAPFSDLDLLFLRPYKPTPHVESVIEFMLYALWDLGFKVGHASRTVPECLRLGREDFTIRTSLLEARLLAGDARLAEDLIHRFRTELVAGTTAEFVAAKLKERDERHARAGASRYLVEPNVKEGKGGLRDLNTLFWIAQYLKPTSTPGELVKLDAFDPRELKAFRRAFDFLWAVRCHLHFAVGRPEERLSFDLQPELARRMGYGDRQAYDAQGRPVEGQPAVERFMRRYFLIAREVGVLTRVFCAKLEEEHAKPRPAGLSRFLPGGGKPRRRALAPGFHEETGRLNVEGPQVFDRDPVNLLRLFVLADRHDLDLHPDAVSWATRALGRITPKVRRDPEAAAAFLQVLAHGRSTYRVLTLMNETGVLGRYLPEFGAVVAQMQFNMYHSYTVDEHTLRAVGVIAGVARGAMVDEHPLASVEFRKIADPEALFLAMLLHDTGKGGEDGQEVAGGRKARTACARMGLTPDRIETVAWLVEHHLAMSDHAQKRDLSDPATIAGFVRLVETPERLRMLLCLTVADIRAVGPGVWNGWKGQLLRELFTGALAVMQADAEPGPAARDVLEARASGARTRLGDRAEDDDPALSAWAAGLGDAYFNAFTPQEQTIHYRLCRDGAAAGGAAQVWTAKGAQVTEAAVAAPDRPGLFADIASAIADFGASVVGARIHTTEAGQALDVFQLQDAEGHPYGEGAPQARDRLARALAGVARGVGLEREGPPTRIPARAAAFHVRPLVRVDNAASAVATVVEVSGRDRPGLLADLGRALAGAGVSVQSAHVETYGETVEDAFYVTRRGAKVTSADDLATLEAGLMTALQPPETAPRRLEGARASPAR